MNDVKCIAVFDDPEHGLKGNVAAVISLPEPLPEQKMQQIAADLNQPATTFLWPAGRENEFHVRWFAPDEEIGLCGHGTLAAVAYSQGAITLRANGKILSGNIHEGDQASMELDAIPVIEETRAPVGLEEALGVTVEGYFRTSNKDIVLLGDENSLTRMNPDFAALRMIDIFGYAVTAPGDTCDFVSRTLVPHVQQLEDHATGSSHAALMPFWSEKLNSTTLTAIQRSPRGGLFHGQLKENKVVLSGHYTIFLEGKVRI